MKKNKMYCKSEQTKNRLVAAYWPYSPRSSPPCEMPHPLWHLESGQPSLEKTWHILPSLQHHGTKHGLQLSAPKKNTDLHKHTRHKFSQWLWGISKQIKLIKTSATFWELCSNSSLFIQDTENWNTSQILKSHPDSRGGMGKGKRVCRKCQALSWALCLHHPIWSLG